MRSVMGTSNGDRQFLVELEPGETEAWVIVGYPGDLRQTRWGTIVQEFINEAFGNDYDVQSRTIWYTGVYMVLVPPSPNTIGNGLYAFWEYVGLVWTVTLY